MSVRVVARIRPLLKLELDKDVIVTAASAGAEPQGSPTVVRIPNPKNDAELFSFQFHSVYEQQATQQDIFDREISPTVKHLFGGFDVTIFAYGVTGTGKTHTMRGGKSLADRGVIPRLLSSVYRRAKKVQKDSAGSTSVEVSMSYYEIYNDRVYDLFEPPEKRTAAGLPIRDNNGKTVVVGLTERPCSTLKEFEHLYDQANVNRSTSATKLNAHSSRSHAILCVKLTQTSADHTLISTASAIDLAGSEDNRRTDNNKDRLVESASINKSLFVLAQCVEAISKKQSRIPYRESKMTRILSLGQNNGLTVMILNLAPTRNYHLDTLSSLNFANRTKKIEVNEVENEPVFRGITGKPTASIGGPTLNRQPLRPLTGAHNIQPVEPGRTYSKPIREFSVYSDKARNSNWTSGDAQKHIAQKRPADPTYAGSSRPTKAIRSSNVSRTASNAGRGLSKAEIEELIERRVDQKLAEKALNEAIVPAQALPTNLQQRLDALEQRVAEKEDSEGLQYLLMGRQHQARGEETSALKMYQLAQPFFPTNDKLARKIASLEQKLAKRKEETQAPIHASTYNIGEPTLNFSATHTTKRPITSSHDADESYNDDPQFNTEDEADADGSFAFHPKPRKQTGPFKFKLVKPPKSYNSIEHAEAEPPTPRTQHLLQIINTRDVTQIRGLKGVGAKKAEAIVSSLCETEGADGAALITDLEQLGALKGVGVKTVENMRLGLGIIGASAAC